MERQREELNALYVALTRARHTLAISSIAPYRETERSWWQRLSSLATQVLPDDHPAPALTSVTDTPHIFYMKELPMVPVEYSQDAEKSESIAGSGRTEEDADSLSARLGKAMHRLLEWGDASSNNTAAAAREFELTPAQGEQAAAMAQRILQGEGAWAWDQAVLGWQGNEVELMYQGEPLRLDRLVQRRDADSTGHWWVLDYKSADAPQDQPELVTQLRNYRAAVQAIYPNEVVRAAFLTGQGVLIEVVDGS